ncbi:hypothetical protein [Acinetobacter baumannii]|uniref:hypothetical protein n=1 Tax=Acinetobacter baumannii TaxID=470 RepID=UPI000DF432AC|nr:hypothetical protein [Acinetobacter baumannii]RCT89675.1 hypothetical protein DVA68_15865 [Acinetobacter baumannii]
MPLKLVLFINDEDTRYECDYPPTAEGLESITPPTDVYVRIFALDKSFNFPENYPDIDDFKHEYKVIWRDD